MKQRQSILALIATACILVLATAALAGTPKQISYQGKATDASGTPLPDGDYAFTFQLYAHPTTGVEHWEEIATVQTAGGLFTHLLGSINPIPDWLFSTYDSLFLQVSIGSQQLSSRIPIVSVGYALSVNTIDQAAGGSIYGELNVRHKTSSELGARIIPGETGVGTLHLYKGVGDVSIALSGDLLGSAAVLFPAGAIEASEMLDEPGVGSDNNNNIFLTGPIQFLAGRTMTAPRDGYVLVIATAFVTIQHSYGTLSSCMFGVSDNITDFASSTIAKITLPSSLPSGGYEFPLSSHALFPISAGSQAYYALGSETGATNATVWNVQLSECFFRTAYTTVSDPMPPQGSTVISSASFDPEAERLEAQAYHNARIQAELDKMKAELEAVKQQMIDLKNSGESKR